MSNFKLITISLTLIWLLQAYPTFEQYTHDFKKSYPNIQQKNYRQSIYQQRLIFFQTITDFIPGVNNFTDWTEQQLKKLRTNVSSNDTNLNNNEQISVSSNLRVGVSSTLDWRHTAVTSIKNQGVCGSCWAFAVTAYVQSALIIYNGYSKNIDLSQQYILSCTSGSDCTGGYIYDAARKSVTGIPTENSFPYYQTVLYNGICSTRNKIIPPAYSALRYRYLSDNRLIALLQKGPVVITLSATNWQFYGGGVFTCSSSATLNHAVLLVGYTQTYWIIKNQWGTSFGMAGYMYITRNGEGSYQNCFIGNQAVVFSLKKSSSFQTTLNILILTMLTGMMLFFF